MVETQSSRVFRFGPFEADLGNRQLLRKGVPVSLGGQPFDVLALLLEHPGQLVTREQLRARLWPPGIVVDFEHSIHTAVTKLREVLGEDAEHPRFIATVPRHGYRFVAPISTAAPSAPTNSAHVPDTPQRIHGLRLPDEPSLGAVAQRAEQLPSADTTSTQQHSHSEPSAKGAIQSPETDSASHTPTARPAGLSAKVALVLIALFVAAVGYLAADRYFLSKRVAVVSIPEKSIAVLPFVDMSADKDQEYLSDGLADELISMLANIPDLRVPARTSSFYFKGKSETIATIARTLGVANVLEGSVRKSGNQLRVTVQLIRADNGYHLWSETYDRELKDVFRVQDEIAAAVVSALNIKLSPGQASWPRRSSNVAAYLQYLLAQQHMSRGRSDDVRRAVAEYRRAVALDPKYTAAYADLAAAEALLADINADPAALERANAAAERAIELSPQQALGYTARGFIRSHFTWDWTGAQTDFTTALRLEPNNPTALHYYSSLLMSLGHLPDAIVMGRRTVDVDPFSVRGWQYLANFLTMSGDLGAAREASRHALAIDPSNEYALAYLGYVELLDHNYADAMTLFQKIQSDDVCSLCLRLSGIAMVEHSLGHTKESQRALDETISKAAQTGAFQIAEAFAWCGKIDKAFEWLERAYRQRDGGLFQLKTDPLLRTLRSDPRYKAMLKELNLPE